MIISVTTVILLLFQKQKLDVSLIKCWIAFGTAVCCLHQISNCMKKRVRERKTDRKETRVSE